MQRRLGVPIVLEIIERGKGKSQRQQCREKAEEDLAAAIPIGTNKKQEQRRAEQHNRYLKDVRSGAFIRLGSLQVSAQDREQRKGCKCQDGSPAGAVNLVRFHSAAQFNSFLGRDVSPGLTSNCSAKQTTESCNVTPRP